MTSQHPVKCSARRKSIAEQGMRDIGLHVDSCESLQSAWRSDAFSASVAQAWAKVAKSPGTRR